MDLERFDNPPRYDDFGNSDPEGTRVDYADYQALKRMLIGSWWGLGISAEQGLKTMRENTELQAQIEEDRDLLQEAKEALQNLVQMMDWVGTGSSAGVEEEQRPFLDLIKRLGDRT